MLSAEPSMLFPISDDDRQLLNPAYVTWTLLAINIVVFLCQMSNPEFTYAYSTIPKEITSGQDITETIYVRTPREEIEIPHRPGPVPIYLTLLTSMFMHGGFGHILGNMLYLWIFGDNVEHRFGHFWFLIFYLSSGLVASFAQIFVDPNSVIPNLGTSGAIAGVLGAYLVLFPWNRVNAVFFYTIVSFPAVFVLGLWGVTQFFQGFGTMFVTEQTGTGGVAYMAHIGGFVTGVSMGFLAKAMVQEEPDTVLRRQYQHDPQARRMW